MNDNENDIQKIQETLAHQDMQINDLSDMVIAQDKEIQSLRLEIKRLSHKIETMEEDAATGESDAGKSISDIAAQNKPPHW